MSRDVVGAPVGVVAALPAEARCLSGRDGRGCPDESLRVSLSGMGQARACRAARSLAGQGVSALVSFGTAGALAPGLGAGDVVLGTAVLFDREIIEADPDWASRLAGRLDGRVRVEQGRIVHAEAVVASPADKSRLFLSTAALAVDMETAGVARAAAEHGLPWLAIRAIVDAQGVSIPPLALDALGADGRPRLGKLLAGIARAPAGIPRLLRLGRDFRAARSALKTVVRLAGHGLGYGPWPTLGGETPSAVNGKGPEAG
ncbi:MAG: purine phosphorylase [Gammaproteobacteria bacterium]